MRAGELHTPDHALKDYRAPWWAVGGHVQTIWASRLASKPRIHYHREAWATPDDDVLAVDWLRCPADEANTPVPQKDAKVFNAVKQPLLAMFHGLEGDSQSHYCLVFMEEARRRRWDGCVVHFRGCGGVPNRLARAYHSGDTVEIDWILRRLRTQRAGPVYVVGVSLGGNALLKWLGENAEGARQVIDAAAALCPPHDLRASAYALAQGVNRLYTRNFLRSLIPAALARLERFPGLYDAKRVVASQSLIDFDEVVTAPLHGFAGAEDYWRRSSCGPFFASIRLPTLVVNALNDPFVPASSLRPLQSCSRELRLSYPAEGGHVGFPVGQTLGRLDYLPRTITHWLGRAGGSDPVCRASSG